MPIAMHDARPIANPPIQAKYHPQRGGNTAQRAEIASRKSCSHFEFCILNYCA